MPREIPEEFIPVVDAVALVCKELGSSAQFQAISHQKWIWHQALREGEQSLEVDFLLDTVAPLLAIYVWLPISGSVEHLDILAQAMAYVNYGLLPGCFELDIRSGEMRHRTVLQLSSVAITPQIVAQLLASAFRTVEVYGKAIQAVNHHGADPLEAVDLAERIAHESTST